VTPDDPAPTPPPRRGWDRRQITVAGIIGLVIVGIGALLAVGLLNRNVNNSIDAAIAKGQRVQAPNFTLPVLTSAPGLPAAGRQVSLSQLRGHPVVLNIWASWCVPCRSEAPILQSVWNHYKSKGVVVLGADVKDLSGDALAFHRAYGLTFPTVRDGEGNIEAPYGTTGVPDTFIIDAQGRIVATLRGQLTDSGSGANIQSFASVLDTVVAEASGKR
jgi:cytochrome c biogenesis protein CcmG, thiol:disulfide interchange protein DsbE